MPVSFGSPLVQKILCFRGGVCQRLVRSICVYCFCLFSALSICFSQVHCVLMICQSFCPFRILIHLFFGFIHFCVFCIVVHVICSLTSCNPPFFLISCFCCVFFGFVCLFLFSVKTYFKNQRGYQYCDAPVVP